MAVYNRYKKLRKAIKYSDGTIVYIEPYEEKKGELVSQTSYETLEDCSYDYMFRWHQIDVTEDENTYICEGYNKYYKEVYQKSTNGKDWSDVEPKQERKGSLIEMNSESCGYVQDNEAIEVWLDKNDASLTVHLFRHTTLYKSYSALGSPNNVIKIPINDLKIYDNDINTLVGISIDVIQNAGSEFRHKMAYIRFPNIIKRNIRFLEIGINLGNTYPSMDSYGIKILNLTQSNFPDLKSLFIERLSNGSEFFKTFKPNNIDLNIAFAEENFDYSTGYTYNIIDFNQYKFTCNYEPYNDGLSFSMFRGDVESIVNNSLKIGTLTYDFLYLFDNFYIHNQEVLELKNLELINPKIQMGLFNFSLTKTMKKLDISYLKLDCYKIFYFLWLNGDSIEEIILDNSYIRTIESPKFKSEGLDGLKTIYARNCDDETINNIKLIFSHFLANNAKLITE